VLQVGDIVFVGVLVVSIATSQRNTQLTLEN
jgi:hypothetical protein